MLPKKSDLCFINRSHLDMIYYGICPKLSLTDLKIFSMLNKECFFMCQEFLNRLAVNKEIFKMKLLTSKLPISNYKCFSKSSFVELCTNQSAIKWPEIFTHYTYKSEIGLLTVGIKRFNFLDKIEKIVELTPSVGNRIEKIALPQNGKVYAICNVMTPKNKLNKKSIVAMDFHKMGHLKLKDVNKEQTYLTEMQVALDTHFLEIYEDKFYINHGQDKVGVYCTDTMKSIFEIACEDVDAENKIVGIKIDAGRIYIRLFNGILHIYDHKSYEKIGTVVGPDCKNFQEHFEIRNKCLYTASTLDFFVTKWKIVDNEKKAIFTDQITLSSSVTHVSPGNFNFQLDGDIIYLGLFDNVVEAYGLVKSPDGEEVFEYLTDMKELITKNPGWKMKNCYVNDGIFFATFFKELKYKCEIINLNYSLRSFEVITRSEAPKKSKFGRFFGLKK